MNKIILVLLLLASCGGSLTSVSLDDGAQANDIVQTGGDIMFLYGTDFASSGQLFVADTAQIGGFVNTGVTSLGSDAHIKLVDGLLYVLHTSFSTGSFSNLQIIDLAQSFKTIFQVSTGSQTNPHDFEVVGSKVYISLYDADRDPTNVTADGKPGDVLIINTLTGEKKRISFKDQLFADALKKARADRMLLQGNHLYVCIEDVGSGMTPETLFEQNAPGKIAVINTDTDTVEKIFTLKGRNPVDLALDDSGEHLFVALEAPFDNATGENAFATSAYGGIESVTLATGASTLTPDESFGGYVERVLVSGSRFVTVVSQATREEIQSFTFTSNVLVGTIAEGALSAASVFVGNGQDIRDVIVDTQDRLWVSERTISSTAGHSSNPGLFVYNLANGNLLGQVSIPIPSQNFSIASMAVGSVQ